MTRRQFGSLAVAALAALGAEGAAYELAVIKLTADGRVFDTFQGVFAPYSQVPLPTLEYIAKAPEDPTGCSAGLASTHFVALVTNGTDANCTRQDPKAAIEEKAELAQKGGAMGMLLVSDDELLHVFPDAAPDHQVNMMVVNIRQSHGRRLRDCFGDDAHARAAADCPGGVLKLQFSLYAPPSMFDLSEFVLMAMATSLVAAGAFFATADLRPGSPIAPRPEEVLEADRWVPVSFCVMGSVTLVVLYFLMRYLIYVIIGFFCLAGASVVTEISHALLRYRFPALQKIAFTARYVGSVEVAKIISVCLALAITISWFLLRDQPAGWVFQDIIGAGFLCLIQQTFRLPNLKIAASLLSLAFFFDIFWVFLSPLIFRSSVMVEVATGGGTGMTVPMLLRIPAFGDPFGNDRMLGFGDVALPGLLLSFLKRHDMLSYRTVEEGYFAPALVGYAVGLFVTLVALFLMQMGQPALLYLVPGTLGTTALLAWRRREFKFLWEGVPCPRGSASTARSMCDYCPSGHRLQVRAAEAGFCNGCGSQVPESADVMDCRVCNWYLCQACRPIPSPNACTPSTASTSATPAGASDLNVALFSGTDAA